MEETATTIATTAAAVNTGQLLAVLGCLISVIMGGLGSSLAIKKAGQKAAGVLAEKPNLFGSLLVLTALPGSQGIYGLLIAIFTLSQIGMLGGTPVEVSLNAGVVFLLAGIVMGILGFSSALLQGEVVAASVGAVAKDGSISGKAIALSVIIETYAIFGLLIAIFMSLAALAA